VQHAGVGQAGPVGGQVDVAAEGDAVEPVFDRQMADVQQIGLVRIGYEFAYD
jgi:hypothetical protein